MDTTTFLKLAVKRAKLNYLLSSTLIIYIPAVDDVISHDSLVIFEAWLRKVSDSISHAHTHHSIKYGL